RSRAQLLPRGDVGDAPVLADQFEVAAAGDVAERAIALAAVFLGREARHERAGGRTGAVARTERRAVPAPEILLAVAVEVQPRDPAGDQRRTGNVMVGLAAGDVLERAAAVAAVVPQARGRAPVAVRDDERVRATVAVEVDEQRVEAVLRVGDR